MINDRLVLGALGPAWCFPGLTPLARPREVAHATGERSGGSAGRVNGLLPPSPGREPRGFTRPGLGTTMPIFRFGTSKLERHMQTATPLEQGAEVVNVFTNALRARESAQGTGSCRYPMAVATL